MIRAMSAALDHDGLPRATGVITKHGLTARHQGLHHMGHALRQQRGPPFSEP
jgi:hypothetical protein